MAALRYFEEIEPGEVFRTGPVPVTREAIIAFAGFYDPQPFHLDEASAAQSLLGGLAASGWHTAALGMRLYYDGYVRHVASMGAPGIDDLRWTRPVRPDDAVSLLLTIGEKRISASRPDRGFVAVTLDLRNAAGETVMVQNGPLMVRRRGHEASYGAKPARRPMPAVPPIGADLMLAAPFDEIAVGADILLGAQRFTPEIITSFAKLYDPQPFHLDESAGRGSHFGGLIASGWQTAAFWMKHYIAARTRATEGRRAAGLPVAVGGPSPGFSSLKWVHPVFPGDTIVYAMSITAKRRTGKDGWGLVTTQNMGHRPDGTLVFSFTGKLLWPIVP